MHLLLRAVGVGIVATVAMDAGGLLGLAVGVAGRGPRRLGPEFIGRWLRYMARGRLRHSDILLTPPLHGEIAVGVVAHYAIGIALALAYLALLGGLDAAPSLLWAVLYGLVTTVLPWFVMLPAVGVGWMGRAAPPGAHLTRATLYNHAVFGLGLALGTTFFN